MPPATRTVPIPRLLRLACLPGLVLIGLAACTGSSQTAAQAGATTSSSGTSPAVRNAAQAGATTSSSGTSSAVRNQDASAFTTCMRANGEPGFPGVTISSDGQVILDGSGTDVDPLSAAYQKAVSTCRHLLPAGSTLPQEPSAPSVPAIGLRACGPTGFVSFSNLPRRTARDSHADALAVPSSASDRKNKDEGDAMTDASRENCSGSTEANGTSQEYDIGLPGGFPLAGPKYACPHCGNPIDVIIVLTSADT
jgi:hypothetical protein